MAVCDTDRQGLDSGPCSLYQIQEKEVLSMKYKDSKVWLRTSSGVVGWDVSDINRRIDEFNSFSWAQEADFFQWLSWEEDDGNDYQGFSAVWSSKLMADVHQIKGGLLMTYREYWELCKKYWMAQGDSEPVAGAKALWWDCEEIWIIDGSLTEDKIQFIDTLENKYPRSLI